MTNLIQVDALVFWGDEPYIVKASRRTRPRQNATATGWVDQYLIRPAEDRTATGYWVDADELTAHKL